METVSSPFAIGRSDEREIANLEARAELLIAIRDLIVKNCWNQNEAAQKLGVSQPRVSNLMNGHIEKFSLGMLMEMLEKLGFQFQFNYESDSENPLTVGVKLAQL